VYKSNTFERQAFPDTGESESNGDNTAVALRASDRGREKGIENGVEREEGDKGLPEKGEEKRSSPKR